MDGYDTKMFLVNVSQKSSDFEQIWRKNDLTKLSLEQTWSEVLADACPTFGHQLDGTGGPPLSIQLASSQRASSESFISISARINQQVKDALKFRPSLDVVYFELTYPESCKVGHPQNFPLVPDSSNYLTMAAHNGSNDPAEDPNASSEMATPTLESVLQVFTTYAKGKEAEIKELKREIWELQREKAAWFFEKKSLNDCIKELQDPLHRQAAGVSGMGVSTDGAGDVAPGQLRSRDESLERSMASVRIGGEHPESCPSPVYSQHHLETDCQVTQLPNTHLEPAPHAQSAVPPGETTAAGGDKEPTAAGGASTLSETTATAAKSQQAALDKLAMGSYSSVEVSSKEYVTEFPVSTEMMTWLSSNIPLHDWKPLMRKLGLSDNEIANASYGHSSIVEQRYQCLLHWRKTRPTGDTTVSVLLKAIRGKSLYQLARDFCKEFPEESSLAEKKRESSPELNTKIYSSDLERFLDPFVANFGALKKDLSNGPRMSASELLKVGCQSLEENGRLDIVFEHLSSTYYKSKDSDSNLDKRRAFRSWLQNCGANVRDIFKKHVNQGGVIGPAMGDDTKIEGLSYSTTLRIEEMLSYKEVSNWKDLADWLRQKHPNVFDAVNKNKIRIWDSDSNPQKGAKSVLQVWETTTQATVGVLYSWLVDNGRLDIAKILE